MNKLIKYLRQIRFVLFVILKRRKPNKKTDKENNVLLVPGGHMGDVLVEISAWQSIIEHYQQQGKQIYILSTKIAWNVFQMTMDTNKLHYFEGDCCVDGTGWSLNVARKLFSSFKTIYFDTIIGHLRDNYSQFIINAIPARQKYIILPQIFCDGVQGKIISRICADTGTKKVIRSPGISETEYWKQLLHILKIPNNYLHIMPIPKHCEKPMRQGKYVTISVDSLNPIRRWPTESFVELIAWLLENYKYDVCITGQKVSSDELSKYNQFTSDKRFFNLVNQVSFNEWVELIRGAQFHIGVDSGSIHIAASVGTQAFCLAGVWHGMEFMPYHLAEIENTKKPICIYREDVSIDTLNCYGCAAKRGYGYGNAECLAQCRASQPCLCLSKITPDDVMAAIHHAQETGVIK